MSGCCSQPEVSIARVAVDHVTDRSAEVSLDAESDGTSVSGPLMMSRVNGRWEIDDYAVDGRSIRASVVPHVTASQTIRGVTVRIVGLYVPTIENEAWMRIANDGPALRIAGVQATLPPTIPIRAGLGGFSDIIQPGRTAGEVSWPYQYGLRTGQKVVIQPELVNTATGRHLDFSLSFTMPHVPGLNG